MHGAWFKIYFDVALTLHNLMLTSQNHANTITSVIAAKQTEMKFVFQ